MGSTYTPLPAPAEAGFTHGYTRAPSSSSLRHVFTFGVSASSPYSAAAQLVRAWRSGQQKAEGWEPYPGVLFNSGSGAARGNSHMRHTNSAAPSQQQQQQQQQRQQCAAAASVGERESSLSYSHPITAAAVAPTLVSASAHPSARVHLLQLVRTRGLLSGYFDAAAFQHREAAARAKLLERQERQLRYGLQLKSAPALQLSWPHLRPDQRANDKRQYRGPVPLSTLQEWLCAFYLKHYRSELMDHYRTEISKLRKETAQITGSARARAVAEAAADGRQPPRSRGQRDEFERGIRMACTRMTQHLVVADAQLVQEYATINGARSDKQIVGAMVKFLRTADAVTGDELTGKRRKPSAGDAAGATTAGAAGTAVPAWSTAVSWYCGAAGASSDVDIFDKLLYCGEEIASDIAASRTGVNSFIIVERGGADGVAAGRRYARVSYYVRHRFRRRCYSFAVPRWYDPASHAELCQLWPNYDLVHSPPPAGHPLNAGQLAAHALRRSLCDATMSDWPVLRWAYAAETLHDLIPVHCIAGRWMPSFAVPPHVLEADDASTAATASSQPTLARGKLHLIFACPVRTHVHG